MRRTPVLTAVLTAMLLALICPPVFAGNAVDTVAPIQARTANDHLALFIQSLVFSDDELLHPPAPARQLPDRAPHLLISDAELLAPPMRRIISPTTEIDLDLMLSNRGRQVHVTGPIACTQAQLQVIIRVTVTQRDTGALAEGRWQGACTTRTRTWRTTVAADGLAAPFAAGAGQACALGVVYERGRRIDAFQWCREVRLKNR